jgi:Spy/CpxP family protein refolding chaperone
MTAYLILALIFAWLAFPAEAQESYRDFEKELNLTDAQRQQVDAINKKYIGEWQSLKNETVRRRLELQEVDQGSPAGRERARRLESELQGIRTSRENLYRQYKGEVNGVLNEQQRGRYDKFVDGERHRGRMPEARQRSMMPESPQRGMMPEPRQRGMMPESPQRGMMPDSRQKGYGR